MTVAVQARYLVEDGVAFADALSWRFRAAPLVGVTRPAAAKPDWKMPAISMPKWRNPAFGKRRVLGIALLSASAIGAPFLWAWNQWPQLTSLRERMGGIVVTDAGGVEGGLLLRRDGLSTRDGDGKIVPRVSMPVKGVPKDFMTAAKTLEGEGILGVSPVNMVRAAVCWPFQSMGFETIGPLRLKQGRCSGGSTLGAIAIRSLTDQRSYGLGRKFSEVMSTISLGLHLTPGSEAHSRFISDTLYFGYARGLPLYGVRSAGRAAFGKDENLALHESALLAGMLLYPVALNCGQPQKSALDRFELIRNRAIYALDRGFRDDPRYETERAKLVSMPAITAPAAAPEALAAGLDSDASCRAGAHPVLRLEALDSSARLASLAMLSKLGEAAADVREVKLSTSFQAQSQFKAQVNGALNSISQQQRGHWQVDPSGSDIVALAFATDAQGKLTALYESTGDAQLYRERELGSLAKIPALLFLAEQGWNVDQFCNKASPPYTNAGGDPGVKSCAGGRGHGLKSVDEVLGRSISLAVMDALRHYPPALLAKRMKDLGISLPENVEPAYAVAFGLARTSPARMQAIFAAVSLGIAGSKPVGREPSIVVSYRTVDGKWHYPISTDVDLSAFFTTAQARAMIERGAKAAYNARATLAALGPAPIGSVGKSGTLDSAESGSVRLKTAAGAWGGRGWFALAVPQTGTLGDSSISIMALARTARDAMMRGNVTQTRD